MDRTAVFLDAGYIDEVLAKEFPGVRIDYGALVRELLQGHDLLRAYCYYCPPYQSHSPRPEELERKRKADIFFNALDRIPRFEVRLGRLEKRQCPRCRHLEFRQKRADLMLGVDLVTLSTRQQIQRAVLVAGDSDLLPAVRVAKDCGVLLHLFHGGRAQPPHQDLHRACDDRTPIDTRLIARIRRGPSTSP